MNFAARWLATSPGPVTLWRMLRPLLTHLYLLCLDVSVSVVLVALNVGLSKGI